MVRLSEVLSTGEMMWVWTRYKFREINYSPQTGKKLNPIGRFYWWFTQWRIGDRLLARVNVDVKQESPPDQS
jgi:hypothetical protein